MTPVQLHELYKDFSRVIENHTLPIDKRKTLNENYYHYIPTNDWSIWEVAKDIKKRKIRKSKCSFIDIGCGVPLIPVLFKHFGFKESIGLEYNKVFNTYTGFIKNGDLFDVDFSRYDVLYSYNPIRNRTLMLKGIEHIISTMKKNAVFYFKNALFGSTELEDLGFEALRESIYVYVKN